MIWLVTMLLKDQTLQRYRYFERWGTCRRSWARDLTALREAGFRIEYDSINDRYRLRCFDEILGA